MTKIFLFSLSLLLCAIGASHAKTKFFFTPSQECEDNIISYINQTNETLDIIIYSLSNEKIVEAIENAHNRGVKVRILTDRVQAGQKSSKVTYLYKKGINIRVNSKHKIQHKKLALFDNMYIFSGSYNWTKNATMYNSENCAFTFDETEAVQSVKDEINYLFEINSQEKSDIWFQKRLS